MCPLPPSHEWISWTCRSDRKKRSQQSYLGQNLHQTCTNTSGLQDNTSEHHRDVTSRVAAWQTTTIKAGFAETQQRIKSGKETSPAESHTWLVGQGQRVSCGNSILRPKFRPRSKVVTSNRTREDWSFLFPCETPGWSNLETPSGPNLSGGKGSRSWPSTSLWDELCTHCGEEIDEEYADFPSSVVISSTEGPETGHTQQQYRSGATESQATLSKASQTGSKEIPSSLTRQYPKWNCHPPVWYWTDMTRFCACLHLMYGYWMLSYHLILLLFILLQLSP